MRVWIVNQNAYTPSESAGTRHYELARRLNEFGHEAVVIATSFYHKSRRETRLAAGQLWKREDIDGATFHWIRTPPYAGNTLRRVYNMGVFAWRVQRGTGLSDLARPDIILGSSPPLSGAFGARLLARRLGVPFVLELRDVWPEGPMHLGSYSARHPYIVLLRRLADYLYREADAFVSVLTGVREYLAPKGVQPERVFWIPNGASIRDLEVFPPVLESASPFRFTYAGAHGVSNAVDRILEAALVLKQRGLEHRIEIRLIGDGTMKERLKGWAATHALNNVRFDEPVPKHRIHAELAEADGFILVQTDAPMLRWGISPNKLFDYMAVGRPILYAVDTPYNPVDQAHCGVTVSQDADSLADGMLAIANASETERREMGHRARAFVESHHDYDALVKQLEEVLENVVAMQRGTGIAERSSVA